MANITKLNETNGWQERVNSLKAYITALGETTLETFATSGFFCSEIKKAHAPATALGVLCHCSAGAVGDQFADAKTTEEKVEAIIKVIAPALTPEQVKAQNLETAKKALTTLHEQKVPVETIKLVVASMPQGKEALAQAGL